MTPRILIIEDNDQNRYPASFLLQHAGCEVSCATDGASGISAARAVRPDLLLMDIRMPGLDGYETCCLLKSDSQTASIPVVAVSSYAMPGDKQRAERAGCCGYIEKPIDPECFARQVLGFLQVKSG